LDTKGYYNILGVSEQAKYYEIRTAYRRLAKKHHPDVNNASSSEEMIKKINAAFEVLSDKDKRKQYDETPFDDSYNTIFREQHVRDDNRHIKDYDKPNMSDKDGRAYSHNYYSQSEQSNDNRNLNKGTRYNYYGKGNKAQRSPSSTTDTFLDVSKNRFHIIVEPSLCMAFGSCETLAPKVFLVEKNKMVNPKAMVLSEATEEEKDIEALLAAAETCPTKAIIIIDRNSGQQIYP
jgi:curved DNA-binding protein CbpA